LSVLQRLLDALEIRLEFLELLLAGTELGLETGGGYLDLVRFENRALQIDHGYLDLCGCQAAERGQHEAQRACPHKQRLKHAKKTPLKGERSG